MGGWNPNGILSSSPGLRYYRYPGTANTLSPTLTGLCHSHTNRSSHSIPYLRRNVLYSSWNVCFLWWSCWLIIYSRVFSMADALTENAPYPPCHANAASEGFLFLIQRLDTRLISFTQSACEIVRDNWHKRCTWSCMPPTMTGEQFNALEAPPTNKRAFLSEFPHPVKRVRVFLLKTPNEYEQTITIVAYAFVLDTTPMGLADRAFRFPG